VVLGCAKAERGQMAPLLEVFAAQEHHVELVSGVDESSQRWREAGQRHGTRAVYVACGGPGLAEAELTALREELLSLGVPAGNIWAAIVDWSQLDVLVREVDRMLEAAPVMVPAPPPLTSARASSPSIAPPPPPAPAPMLTAGSMQVVGLLEGTAGSIAPMPPPSPARLVPLGPSHEPSQVLLAPRPVVDAARSPEGLEPFDTMVGRRMGSLRRVAMMLGTLAVAGFVGAVMLASASSTSADDGSKPSEPAAEATVAARERPAATSSSRAPGGTEPKAADATARAQPAALPHAGTPASAPAPQALAAASPAAEDDDALVHAALMQRKIRALDILLVSPEATRKVKGRRTPRTLHTGWTEARTYCESLELAGVDGWRLPTAGELRTLGSSNMLGRRIYWTATEGDAFGSDRLVWNNHKKRMAPAPGAWKGGRVVCVRLQHPERAVPA
jgi:hypothetical protein